MTELFGVPRLATRFFLCLAVAAVVTILGCNPEVGSAPSGKEQMRSYVETEASKGVTPTTKTRGKMPAAGKVPKSIKSKVLGAEPAN
jgi:hypothetical protein